MADKKKNAKTAEASVKNTADKKVNSLTKKNTENKKKEKSISKSVVKKTIDVAKKTPAIANSESTKKNNAKIKNQPKDRDTAEVTANSAKQNNNKTKSTLNKTKSKPKENSTLGSDLSKIKNEQTVSNNNIKKVQVTNQKTSNPKNQNKKSESNQKNTNTQLKNDKSNSTSINSKNEKSNSLDKGISNPAIRQANTNNQKKFNKNPRNNNYRNYPEKRKTLTFSFQLLAAKNANQVSLNKVKQVFDDINENQKKTEPPIYINHNIITRYNFVDLNNFSIAIGKSVLPNPAYADVSTAPYVFMNRFKFQKFESSENIPKSEELLTNNLILENDLFKINYYSKNSPTASKNTNKKSNKEPQKPKTKKLNKFEEEAKALKNEVFILPDINYIKYTFPELEEEKEKRAQEKNQHSEVRFTKINPDKKIIFTENLNPFLREMYDEILYTLEEDFSIAPGSKILLAVSGGVDSIAMLDIFAQLSQELKLTLSVAHFNHKLRGSASDKDEEMVKKICDEYGIKCYLGSENILKFAGENSISIEQAARINRYKMFERLSGNLKLDYVATAHTSDDSVETFFLNLMRGTGLTGLSGIPRKRIFFKSTYLIRPLLKINKEKLINYAQIRALTWNEDKTNLLTNYTRNKIRLELLPKIKNEYSPAIFSLIERTSKLIKGADEFISNYVSNAVNSIIYDRRKDRFTIPIAQLQTYTDYIQTEIIQEAFATVFSSLPLNTKTIDRIFDIIEAPVGSVCNINKNYYVLKDRNKLIFAMRNGTNSINQLIGKNSETNLASGTIKITEIPRNKVEFTRDPNIEFVDADLLPTYLLARNWQTGDVFKPIGMDGSMKISDFLTNQKVSQIDKQSILVLSTKSEIIWIVGRRLSNDFKVTPSTNKVLKFEFIPFTK